MAKLEVFSGDPPCPGCVAIVELAQQVAAGYAEDELELTIYSGEEAVSGFESYGLGCVPAAVVNGRIRIEGICPSEATLLTALREGGLCLK